jgi:hypothetical protein
VSSRNGFSDGVVSHHDVQIDITQPVVITMSDRASQLGGLYSVIGIELRSECLDQVLAFFSSDDFDIGCAAHA